MVDAEHQPTVLANPIGMPYAALRSLPPQFVNAVGATSNGRIAVVAFGVTDGALGIEEDQVSPVASIAIELGALLRFAKQVIDNFEADGDEEE